MYNIDAEINLIKAVLAGADLNDPSLPFKTDQIIFRIIGLAIKNEHLFYLIPLFIFYGANINAINENGATIIHTIAYIHLPTALKILNFLIKQKANLNSLNKQLQTPLHIAAECHNYKITQKLLENSANINAQDNCGFTPLHLAAYRQGESLGKLNFDFINLLLSYDADNCILHNSGQSAAIRAMYGGNVKLAEFLILRENGLNVLKGIYKAPFNTCLGIFLYTLKKLGLF